MRLFGRKKTVSAWASFFDEKEYAVFMDAIRGYFGSMKIEYEIADGVLYPRDSQFGCNQQLGMDNLARVCKQSGLSDYPQAVADHFNGMLEDMRFEKEFDLIRNDFGKVSPYLAVRLYAHEYMDCLGREYFLGKELAGELFAAIVFDFPNTIRNVKPDEATPWGRTTEELTAIGLQNVRQNYAFGTETIEFGDEGEHLIICEQPHYFASNILLELGSREEFIAKDGALAAAPTRNTALIYPIRDLKMIGAIHTISRVATNMYEKEAGNLSKELYWYFGGAFTVIPYEITEDAHRISPPQEFVDMMNSLA